MIYDMDNDGFISNGELFQVLKMMVGNNLKETQLQQIVDKTVINADKDGDGKISFSEFCAVSTTFWASNLFCMKGSDKNMLSCHCNCSYNVHTSVVTVLYQSFIKEIERV